MTFHDSESNRECWGNPLVPPPQSGRPSFGPPSGHAALPRVRGRFHDPIQNHETSLRWAASLKVPAFDTLVIGTQRRAEPPWRIPSGTVQKASPRRPLGVRGEALPECIVGPACQPRETAGETPAVCVWGDPLVPRLCTAIAAARRPPGHAALPRVSLTLASATGPPCHAALSCGERRMARLQGAPGDARGMQRGSGARIFARLLDGAGRGPPR